MSLFLRAPRNAGLRAHNDEIVGQGTWPPLVDEKTWRAAQSVLNAPGRAPGRKTVRRHLLTGVLGCGKCGHHLSGNHTNDKRITHSCKQCRGVSVRAEHVEPLVMGLVAGRLARPDAVDLLKTELHDEAEAEQLRGRKQTLRARLDEIADVRADGLLTGAQAKRATDRAEGEQGGDGACGGCPDVVAAGSAGFVDEPFAPQLAQVVGRLADGVAAVIDTGEGVHLGGELGDGEPVRRWRQRQGGAQRVTHAGFVEVDTADPGGTQPDAGGQLIEDAVAEESGVHTIQGGGEPLDDAGQPGDDLGKLLDHPPAAQLRVLCAIASNLSTRSPLV